MKKYLCLLALYPCIEMSAVNPSLAFPEQKIELPSLSLLGSTQRSALLPVAGEAPYRTDTFPKDLWVGSATTRAVKQHPTFSADKFVVTPNDGVDYKLIVKHPDPGVDYKLIVKEVESTTRK